MSAQDLGCNAQQHQSKARFEAGYSIISGLVLCGLFALAFAHAHEMVPRMGWGLLSLGGGYFAWQAYRWFGERLETDAALSTSVRSYRGELEKRRDYVRRLWSRTGLASCWLGVAMVVAPVLIQSLNPPHARINWVPILLLLAIWVAVLFPRRARPRQNLQKEVDQLVGLEKESRGWQPHSAPPRSVLCDREDAAKKPPRLFDRGGWQGRSNLKQIPEELVVDLVVELDFLRFDEGSEGAGAAVGGGLLKVCVAALDVFAEQG